MDGVPGQELIKRGNAFENQTLLTIAYLGAALQDDINVRTACKLHLAVMPFVATVMKASRSAYRRIAAPFVREYWFQAFAKARFEFSAPRIVEHELMAAVKVVEEKQPAAVLLAVSNGLGIIPKPSAREWLLS